MNCDALADRLTDFLEGDLTPADEAAALEHLSTCESCERVLLATTGNIDAIKEHGKLTLSSADRARLLGDITEHLPN